MSSASSSLPADAGGVYDFGGGVSETATGAGVVDEAGRTCAAGVF